MHIVYGRYELDPASQANGLGHPIDCHQVSGDAIVDLLGLSHLVDAVEGLGDLVIQTLVGQCFIPVELVRILNHLEVRNGHPTGIA